MREQIDIDTISRSTYLTIDDRSRQRTNEPEREREREDDWTSQIEKSKNYDEKKFINV